MANLIQTTKITVRLNKQCDDCRKDIDDINHYSNGQEFYYCSDCDKILDETWQSKLKYLHCTIRQKKENGKYVLYVDNNPSESLMDGECQFEQKIERNELDSQYISVMQDMLYITKMEEKKTKDEEKADELSGNTTDASNEIFSFWFVLFNKLYKEMNTFIEQSKKNTKKDSEKTLGELGDEIKEFKTRITTMKARIRQFTREPIFILPDDKEYIKDLSEKYHAEEPFDEEPVDEGEIGGSTEHGILKKILYVACFSAYLIYFGYSLGIVVMLSKTKKIEKQFKKTKSTMRTMDIVMKCCSIVIIIILSCLCGYIYKNKLPGKYIGFFSINIIIGFIELILIFQSKCYNLTLNTVSKCFIISIIIMVFIVFNFIIFVCNIVNFENFESRFHHQTLLI